ncbi:MAG: acyl-CoA thioesterase [Fidelibacterota bacterium]
MSIKAHYSQLVMPHQINNVGTLFGGQLVSWMDMAAAKVAYRFLKGTQAWGAVTRVIEEVEFRHPIYAGEWVTFAGHVVAAGKSSITIHIDAYAESRDESQHLACTARIVMVAVHKNIDGNFTKFIHGKHVE